MNIYIFLLVHYTPLTSIFSTRVISGAKSTPDLNKLLERKQAGRMSIFLIFNLILSFFFNLSYMF